jgi:hypothetical protein
MDSSINRSLSEEPQSLQVNKESKVKKYLMTIASLLTMVGIIGFAQVGAAAAKPSRTTHAPHAISAQTREAALAKLGHKRLSSQELRRLGLRRVSGKQLARIRQLRNHRGMARTSAVGTYYWFTWQNARNSWVDRYYSGAYYSYPWYPYYVVYDNFKTCTYSGYYCIDANAYTYQYLLYYYPNGTWYYYNTGGYQSNSTDYSGWGPY